MQLAIQVGKGEVGRFERPQLGADRFGCASEGPHDMALINGVRLTDLASERGEIKARLKRPSRRTNSALRPAGTGTQVSPRHTPWGLSSQPVAPARSSVGSQRLSPSTLAVAT